MLEWVKYSAYGVPFALPAGDTDSDGDCDSADDAQVTTWKNAPAYDVRGDLNLDGEIDADDEALVVSAHQALGRGVLTSSAVGNRKGYAGYEGDAKLSAKWHVRHRVLDSVLGCFMRRDLHSEAYGESLGLHGYCAQMPLRAVDPTGEQLVDDPSVDDPPTPVPNACGSCSPELIMGGGFSTDTEGGCTVKLWVSNSGRAFGSCGGNPETGCVGVCGKTVSISAISTCQAVLSSSGGPFHSRRYVVSPHTPTDTLGFVAASCPGVDLTTFTLSTRGGASASLSISVSCSECQG